MFNYNPQLQCGSTDISPFRIVKMDTTAWQGVPATAAGDYVVGVSDGSTRRFDSSVHATLNDPISLQPSPVVQIEADAGGWTAGCALKPGTAGKALKTTTSADVALFVALEAASAGEIAWAYRLNATKAIP